jgi:hypothetical protein
MELLDRYLQSVRTYLPRRQQDDITRELRENLLSEVEDKEAVLGRSLTEAELEAMLQQHGHPMLVASRYARPQHQHLIGPAIFPAYRLALRMVLWVTVAINLAVGAVRAFTIARPASALLEAAANTCLGATLAFGVVTAVFALLERYQVRLFSKWSPRSLPRIRKGTAQVPRLASVAELALLAVALWWWLAAPHYLGAIFETGEVRFLKAGPGLELLYLPYVLLLAATMVQPLVNLFRPHWIRFRLMARTTTDAASAVLLSISLRVGRWIVLADTNDTLASHQRVADLANHWARVGVAITIAAISLAILLRLRQLLWPRGDVARAGVSNSLPASGSLL